MFKEYYIQLNLSEFTYNFNNLGHLLINRGQL